MNLEPTESRGFWYVVFILQSIIQVNTILNTGLLKKRSLDFFNWTAGLQCFKFVSFKSYFDTPKFNKKKIKILFKKYVFACWATQKRILEISSMDCRLATFQFLKKDFYDTPKNSPQKNVFGLFLTIFLFRYL